MIKKFVYTRYLQGAMEDKIEVFYVSGKVEAYYNIDIDALDTIEKCYGETAETLQASAMIVKIFNVPIGRTRKVTTFTLWYDVGIHETNKVRVVASQKGWPSGETRKQVRRYSNISCSSVMRIERLNLKIIAVPSLTSCGIIYTQ